jgi:hypothetical protein
MQTPSIVSRHTHDNIQLDSNEKSTNKINQARRSNRELNSALCNSNKEDVNTITSPSALRTGYAN